MLSLPKVRTFLFFPFNPLTRASLKRLPCAVARGLSFTPPMSPDELKEIIDAGHDL